MENYAQELAQQNVIQLLRSNAIAKLRPTVVPPKKLAMPKPETSMASSVLITLILTAAQSSAQKMKSFVQQK